MFVSAFSVFYSMMGETVLRQMHRRQLIQYLFRPNIGLQLGFNSGLGLGIPCSLWSRVEVKNSVKRLKLVRIWRGKLPLQNRPDCEQKIVNKWQLRATKVFIELNIIKYRNVKRIYEYYKWKPAVLPRQIWTSQYSVGYWTRRLLSPDHIVS